MKDNNLDFGITSYSILEEFSSKIISLVTVAIKSISSYIDRAKLEQFEVTRQMRIKRQMQQYLRRDTFARMTLDEKLRLGFYREFGNYRDLT